MAHLFVDVDLNEVSDSELIEELEGRSLSTRHEKRLLAIVNNIEREKWKVFSKNKNRFSLSELENLLSEKFEDTYNPKQLKFDYGKED